MIEMRKVCKWFGAFQALRDVDLSVAKGEASHSPHPVKAPACTRTRVTS